jgi:hypothetical protein
MRVRLSYTVEEEDVLSEASKILGLSGEDLQHAITLFKGIQTELIKDKEDVEEVVNINKCLEMITEFRKALYSLDTRLEEIADIIEGYDEFRRGDRHAPTPTPQPEEEMSSPSVILEESSE